MKFSYENQMVESAENWLRSKDLSTKREFSTPWGICDLVGCSLNKNNIKKRLKHRQTKPIGPQLRVFILSQIPDQEDGDSVAFSRLDDMFRDHIGTQRLQKELAQLKKNRFLNITPEGAFQKINGWMPLHKKLVALELKLSRVNEVLHQAICNLEFADESYVGLPAETAKRVFYGKKKHDFIEHGVGILAVGKTCRVLLKSRNKSDYTNKVMRTHCAERFWQSHPTDSLT